MPDKILYCFKCEFEQRLPEDFELNKTYKCPHCGGDMENVCEGCLNEKYITAPDPITKEMVTKKCLCKIEEEGEDQAESKRQELHDEVNLMTQHND